MGRRDEFKRGLWIAGAAAMLAISGCNNKQTNQPIHNSTQVVNEIANEMVNDSEEGSSEVLKSLNGIQQGYSITDILNMIKEESNEITEFDKLRFIKLLGENYVIYLSDDAKDMIRMINSNNIELEGITESKEFKALVEEIAEVVEENGEEVRSSDFDGNIEYVLNLIEINSDQIKNDNTLRFLRALCTKYNKQIPDNFKQTIEILMQDHKEDEIKEVIEREDVHMLAKCLQEIISKVEEIDGVIVVHTGMKIERGYLYINGKAINQGFEEILEMYDTNGNRFYSNCSSIEEAKELVKKLKREGKNAIIGPKAPWRGPEGQPIKNRDENAVGVYIIEEKEVEKGIEPGE